MKKITIITLLAIFILSSCTSNQSQQATLQVQGDSNSSIVLYYGDTCPHCHDVLDWLKENDPENKAGVLIKEVYNDQANSNELQKVAQICDLGDQIYVPFLFADNQCFIGTPDITNYLQTELNL